MPINNQVIGYNDSFWRLEYEFKYTKDDQPFTLPPGKYLFVCHGAPGGQWTYLNNNINGGGTSYGVLNLNKTTTFHAVVGGVGANATTNYSLATGGFNGGAHGGVPYSSSYNAGAGGGGASDVRLLPYDPDEYPTYDTAGNMIPPVKDKQIYYDTEYDELSPSDQHKYYGLEYIRSTNRSYPINTGFIFKSNYQLEIDLTLHGNRTNYQAIIGTKNESSINGNPYMGLFLNYNNTNNACIIRLENNNTLVNVSLSDSILKNERTTIKLSHNMVQQLLNGQIIYEQSYGDTSTTWKTPSTEPVYINSSHGSSGHDYNNEDSTVMQLYSFKGYNDNDELVKHLIPVMRVSDSTVGLFDIITNTFSQPVSSDTSAWWDAGPFVINAPSLNSRIIVAGGGGGSPQLDPNSGEKCISGFGGGTCGGPVNGNIDGLSYGFFSTQTQGYSFGFGQFPTPRVIYTNYTSAGAGGGGGGWFGGFASIDKYSVNVLYRLNVSGGGGSGYVLTSSSYKPSGYTPSSDYYFTNTRMTSHTSFEPKICIYKLTFLNIGDIVTFPQIGQQEHIKLPPGEYALECYGGSGGIRVRAEYCTRGGYAKGIFTTARIRDAYVNVGGCGGPFVWMMDHDGRTYDVLHTNSTFVSQSYNGGRIPQAHYTDMTKSGGGTDIRIDGDSLYHRIIVAGGAGSEGAKGYYGGAGGGETGGNFSGSSYGSNNGPGTQTESPNSIDPSVAGDFGIGGLGKEPSSSMANIRSGSGGGGWFGGSGTGYNGYNNDYQKSGSGGSGYVLTDSSYIIEGYQLDPTVDALTNTQLIQGGNNLNPFETKATITVNEIYFKCLCKDIEGIKYFDDIEQSWILTPTQTMTPELFEEYGSKFINDNGLSNEYKVYVYDVDELINKLIFDIIPNKQIVDINTGLSVDASSVTVDDDYKSSDYNIACTTIKKHDETTGNMLIHLRLSIDQLTNDADTYRAYGTVLPYTLSNQPHDYVKLDEDGRRLFKHYITNGETHEITIEERTMELDNPNKYRDPVTHQIIVHQSLLRVGQNNKIPFKYLNLLEPDATYIYTSIMTGHNRIVYLLQAFDASGISGRQMTIKALNVQTGTVTSILRIPISSFYSPNISPINGFLVDDEYFYLSTTAYSYGSAVYRKRFTKINIKTGDISITSESAYNMYTTNGGHIEWLDDHRILAISESSYDTRMMIYDTKTNSWEYKALSNNGDPVYINSYRWTLGEKYMIISNHSGSDKYIRLYDKYTGNFVGEYTFQDFNLPVFTYHNGKFYIVNRKSYIYELDEETLEFTKLATVSIIGDASFVKYVNGALYITQLGDYTNKLIVYKLKEKIYSTIYTPWRQAGSETTSDNWFEPCEMNGIFFYGINTLLMSDYSGQAKYKFGKKFNQYYISFANDNIENITCDDRFISVDEAGLYNHSGLIEYQFSSYNTNHIASCDVSKSDYKFILSVNVSMDIESS